MSTLSKNKFNFEKNVIQNFLLYRKEDRMFFPFFRISIGLFFLVHFISTLSDFSLLYTDDGLIPLNVLSLLRVEVIPTLNIVLKLLNGFGVENIYTIYAYIILYILFCITLTVGLFSRFSAIVLLLLHIILFQSSNAYMYGVDYFKSIAMFYCAVFPVGSKLSLDATLFKKKEFNPSPYRNLLKIHLSIVYFTSGLDKAFGVNWWNGESIWKSFHLPGFESYIIENYDVLSSYPILPTFIGISTMCIELLYPLFMWKKSMKAYWLILVLGLHMGIIIAMNLYFFGALMILLNLSGFLNLEEKGQVAHVS
ncbi:hypothetical protein C1637_03490 [Chryseobacterium lactis]|nr:hypothetical protein C1637_03490 [Chryseobacterium lactis]